MSILDKVHIGCTAIGGRIVLARKGKDPNDVLETREASFEFFRTLVEYAFPGDLPKPGEGRNIDLQLLGMQFTLTIPRKNEPEAEATPIEEGA